MANRDNNIMGLTGRAVCEDAWGTANQGPTRVVAEISLGIARKAFRHSRDLWL